jgi:hypothetical protein
MTAEETRLSTKKAGVLVALCPLANDCQSAKVRLSEAQSASGETLRIVDFRLPF